MDFNPIDTPMTEAPKALRDLFKALLKENGPFMLEYKNKNLYLLHQHWRHLNPIKDAKRVLVCKDVKKPKLHEVSNNHFYIHSLN
jgi:hypothetical protein